MGDLHDLGLREAVLLGDFLADVFEKRNHGVEGGSVRDELRVSLALPPLGLHSVSLLLHRLQAALLDRGVLNWGCRLWDLSGVDTHPAVVHVLNLGPGDLHILAHILSHGLAGLGGDGVLLSGAVRSVVQQRVTKPKLRLGSGESLAGSCQQEETDQVVHVVAGWKSYQK